MKRIKNYKADAPQDYCEMCQCKRPAVIFNEILRFKVFVRFCPDKDPEEIKEIIQGYETRKLDYNKRKI